MAKVLDEKKMGHVSGQDQGKEKGACATQICRE
jgi:hypothetical protein